MHRDGQSHGKLGHFTSGNGLVYVCDPAYGRNPLEEA